MKLPLVKTDIQVRFSDIDILGHVSNSVYAQYFDMGRIEWYSLISEQENPSLSVVVSIKMDMLDEIKLNDKVHIETWCSELGNKSFMLNQNIYANGKCVTTGSVTSVTLNRKTQKPILIPDHWEVSEYQQAPESPQQTAVHSDREKQITDFIKQYCGDYKSSTVEGMGQYFADTITTVRDNLTSTYQGTESFIGTLSPALQSLIEKGFSHTVLGEIGIHPLNDKTTCVSANFLRLNTKGQLLEEVGATYIVLDTEGGLKIATIIHHDIDKIIR